MRKVITLFEYSPAEKEELDHLKKLEEKLAKINRMMGVKILEKTFTTIKATHYVGVISIGNTTIQILPKLYNSNKKNREEIIKDATRNLLFMLTLTKRLKIREVGISKLKKEVTNLYEVIIYLFAKNLFEMLKYNYKRDYEQREKDLKFIKGKIRMSKQIRKPTHHKIHCSYFDLSENILIHRILKYTCYLLSSRVRSKENWLLLQNILSIYDNVELKPTKLSDFDKIRFNRLNEEYEPFVNLARLFLENMSLELQSSHFVTFSLLFDMNTLFEEFLGEILKKHRKELLGDTKFNECKIYLNKRRKWLIEDPRSFKLRPDIILSEKERVRLIIDAKYKLL